MTHTRYRHRITLTVGCLALGVSISGAGQLPPASPPATRCDGCTVDSVAGRSAWTVFENERVLVEGRHYPPGQRTDPPGASHAETVPRDVIIILGTAPFDFLKISLK